MSVSDTALVTVVQALTYLRIEPPVTQITNELVDKGDGATKVFELAQIPIADTLTITIEGEEQTEGEDYTYDDTTLTFDEAPADGDRIRANYQTLGGDISDYQTILLESFIESATKRCEDYTGLCFVQREIAENRVGDGKNVLLLYKRPVVSVDSVYIDGELLVADDDYGERLAIGRLYRNAGWDLNSEIEIVYIAGYGEDRGETLTLIPEAVMAVLETISVWWNNRMGVKSENVSGIGSVDYGEVQELPQSVKAKLSSLKVNPLC